MLNDLFQQRVQQFISVKIEEPAIEAREEFSRNSANAAQRGLLHSGYSITLHHQTSISQIQKRVAPVLEIQKRVLHAMAIPYSSTLAEELKTQLESYIPETWCARLIDSYPRMEDSLKGQHHSGLIETRRTAIRRASMEIDLLVDELKSKIQEAVQSTQRELEQNLKSCGVRHKHVLTLRL